MKLNSSEHMYSTSVTDAIYFVSIYVNDLKYLFRDIHVNIYLSRNMYKIYLLVNIKLC